MSAKAVPDRYHSVTPYLIVRNAAKAIAFYKHVFEAKEDYRLDMPDGRIGHAEIRIGNSVVMLADESPEMNALSPVALGGTPVTLAVYTEDVDTMYARALASGALERRKVKTEFYGDRTGTVVDPFGHVWTIATHVEDVSPDDMKRRMAAGGA